MKPSIAVLAPSALAFALLSGCAPTAPPELVDARAAYNRAQSGPAQQTNRAGVLEAQQALTAAERKYNESPSSNDVKTLGYVAERKAELAEANGRAAAARAEQQRAEMTFLQLQTMAAQKQAEKERRQSVVSERRAKVALDRLGLAAKDEPRGTVVTLPGASMFATDKAEILPSARGRLSEVAAGVKEAIAEGAPADTGRKMTLIGYTDSTGSEAHNMDLSERRAHAVLMFFSQYGIRADMMDAEGRGPADPIAPNDTPQGRAENRRVEIVIAPPAAGGP